VSLTSEKLSDGFFFLAWFQIEIDAAGMILAEFGRKHGEQLAKRFAVAAINSASSSARNRSVAFGM